VTLQHILTHTAGLAVTADGRRATFSASRSWIRGDFAGGVQQTLGGAAAELSAGTQWQYTGGVGFAVLGRVVEIVSGMNLEQFFKQRILTR